MASGLTCSRLAYAATWPPEMDTPEEFLGQENGSMSNSILVVYATRAGSTVEVAQAIAETLATRGFKVDVKPAKGKPKVEGYKAVLIGSGIRMGNWLPEAVNYVKKNQQFLNRVPVALFTVHMLNSGEDEESVANRLAYLNSVHPGHPGDGPGVDRAPGSPGRGPAPAPQPVGLFAGLRDPDEGYDHGPGGQHYGPEHGPPGRADQPG